MAKEMFQALLNVPGCSGRGVRYRLLPPSERDAVLKKAASAAGEKASGIDMRLTEFREGIKAMLVSVTAETGFTTFEQLAGTAEKPTKWEALSAEKLELPGPLMYDALFNAKDDAVLTGLYRRAHEVTQAEVDAIAGKALPVSAD